jgi:sulfoxide reductase heme-binding subunit YedZ
MLVTLAITPLRYLTAWGRLMPLRRMVGLFTFFYACLHFLTYGVDYWFFDLDAIMDDVINRPYITAGFTGFVLLIPLAVTSTHAMVRRLGGRRWQQLHRLVYLSAAAGAAHFLWQTKIDLRRPGIYIGWLALLFGIRLWEHFASRWRRRVTG